MLSSILGFDLVPSGLGAPSTPPLALRLLPASAWPVRSTPARPAGSTSSSDEGRAPPLPDWPSRERSEEGTWRLRLGGGAVGLGTWRGRLMKKSSPSEPEEDGMGWRRDGILRSRALRGRTAGGGWVWA